ncbi:SnoaL-like domain protein [Bremerella volcania]|uniref:SnoaL-like domain protein n=1 Tax=Bremerella volcania TaxID=2527984 RepID=A0A518C509_9BACT|nr:SgcJ/EcaC family oxidoreductase [Bremerella volcania]QDU74274.1 SnoaL-like domain protein [Bremerella volcania]
MKFLSSPSRCHLTGKIGDGLLACSIVLLLSAAGYAQSTEPTNKPLEKELQTAFQAFEKAFNQHDAKAIANLWQEDAVHHQTTVAGNLKGRAAILAAYEALFQADPQAKLVITLNSFREVAPNVVSVKCSTQLSHSDKSVSFSRLSALLAKHDDQWLISEVEETDVPPSAAGSPSGLQQLEWLVGVWVDGDEKATVSNQVYWISGGNFLARNYQMNTPQGFGQYGMQILGWDNEHNVIRCWQFDGDGSFGEGTFEQTGPATWRCPMVVKLVDGRRASYSQVIERVSPNELKLSLVNMEVDGHALPGTGPDKLTRYGN